MTQQYIPAVAEKESQKPQNRKEKRSPLDIFKNADISHLKVSREQAKSWKKEAFKAGGTMRFWGLALISPVLVFLALFNLTVLPFWLVIIAFEFLSVLFSVYFLVVRCRVAANIGDILLKVSGKTVQLGLFAVIDILLLLLVVGLLTISSLGYGMVQIVSGGAVLAVSSESDVVANIKSVNQTIHILSFITGWVICSGYCFFKLFTAPLIVLTDMHVFQAVKINCMAAAANFRYVLPVMLAYGFIVSTVIKFVEMTANLIFTLFKIVITNMDLLFDGGDGFYRILYILLFIFISFIVLVLAAVFWPGLYYSGQSAALRDIFWHDLPQSNNNQIVHDADMSKENRNVR